MPLWSPRPAPGYWPRSRATSLLVLRRKKPELTSSDISADIAAQEIGMLGLFRKQSTASPNRSSGTEESSIESKLYTTEKRILASV
jgi:hypothetical protein